jgi:hypothetical protein
VAKKNEERFHDLEVMREFIINNWKKAGEIGWEKQQKRALETRKAEADKKKKAEDAPTKEVASWS